MQEDLHNLKDEIMNEDFYSLTCPTERKIAIVNSEWKSNDDFKWEKLKRSLKDKEEEIHVLWNVINKLKGDSDDLSVGLKFN